MAQTGWMNFPCFSSASGRSGGKTLVVLQQTLSMAPGGMFPESFFLLTWLCLVCRRIRSFQPSSSFSFSTHCVPLYPHLLNSMASTRPHNLAATGFVYVRHDAHRGPLQRPYAGPFKILETAEKHFILDINGRWDAVSVDRLKVAYGQKDQDAQAPSTAPPMPTTDAMSPPPTLRFGRPIRPPQRYS